MNPKARLIMALIGAASLGLSAAAQDAVPDDVFLKPVKAFAPPEASELKEQFLLCHRLLESCYNGDGSWGKGYREMKIGLDSDHPVIRWTGNPVMAYLTANAVEPNPVFVKRAKEGLEYLLRDQVKDGSFRWYVTTAGTLDVDSMYDTGVAGRALVAGYEAFKDQRYLEASAKAAAWEMERAPSGNANYNMFAVWHLAAHYRVTHEDKILENAVQKTVATLKDQLPSGKWSDVHNQIINYHCIIVQGLAELLSVLPKDHPEAAKIRKGVIRAINHVIRSQTADGNLGAVPNKYAPGVTFGLPAFVDARFSMGLKDLDTPIAGMAAAPLGFAPDQKDQWITMLDCVSLRCAKAWQWRMPPKR